MAAVLLAGFFFSLPWQHGFYGRRAARAEEQNLLPPRSAAAG